MNDKEIIDIFLLLDAGEYPDLKLYDCATYKAALGNDLTPTPVFDGSATTEFTSANSKPVVQKMPVVKSKFIV